MCTAISQVKVTKQQSNNFPQFVTQQINTTVSPTKKTMATVLIIIIQKRNYHMNKILVILTILAMSISAYAQPQGGRPPQRFGADNSQRREFSPDEYHKRMREFITCQAKLTPQEADKFFPLFFEMLDKQHKLMEKQHAMIMKGKKDFNFTEADCEKILLLSTEMEVESKKIEQSYYKKFHNVLSWKKVLGVRMSYERFKREALNMFNPKGNGNRRMQPGF